MFVLNMSFKVKASNRPQGAGNPVFRVAELRRRSPRHCPSVSTRLGALEVHEVHEDSACAVQEMDIPVGVLGRSSRGAELLQCAETVRIPEGRGVMWISGEATSLVPVKQRLLERGLERSMLRIKPYWSIKGKAHRKVLERGELR